METEKAREALPSINLVLDGSGGMVSQRVVCPRGCPGSCATVAAGKWTRGGVGAGVPAGGGPAKGGISPFLIAAAAAVAAMLSSK